MAASHRQAKLAAASLHLPVNPKTGARVAQYEREDLLEALAAAASQEEDEDDSDTDSSLEISINYDDIMSFSDMCHSNKEYFKKLEELKAAHIKTMAKLEKMYWNKLNLKDVQPVTVREDVPSNSSSSESENNSCCPVVSMTSLSEPDLVPSSSFYTSSEEELANPEKEHPKKNKKMTYAKELINNMWKNFCVEDYIQGKDTDLQVPEKTRKKPKEWVSRITIPVPFQMMIREQKKKEEAKKSKSDIETGQKLLKNEDDSECKKKFRANPVPLSVLLPLYHELVKQNEEQRRARKEKNKQTLLALQKPFTFIAREEQKQAAREKQLRDYLKTKKKTHQFKARPIPLSNYGSATSNKLKEEEHLRNIRAQLRAQKSAAPSCRPGHKHSRRPKYPEQAGKSRSRHKARSQTPDAEDLPKESKKQSSEHKWPKPSAAQRPPVSSSKSAERQNVLSDEENLKQTRWCSLSPRHKSPGRSASTKPASYSCTPPAPTASSRGREEAIRKNEKERMKEYRRELEEREEKLKMRPLLFERVSQNNARMAAEKHYSNKLKALGISDEFVSKKGKSGKVFEYFSNQEMKSFTGDKESFNEEEKVEERENGEENYFIDTSSQDSCKENAEDDEESGEVSAEG
ncbi:protein FAM161A isoform X2 [Cavia porcellus]|uniref:protein FAM161A isoform X2 n=1 Tax=Cavia porcellus TaxID=10141 RepID=UPI000661E2C4|nr:protein FAM161A isoform X2 [Cavia porcellus]